jgi:hypothetical protein
MKKNLFYLFMLLAVVAMPFVSCENNTEKGDGQKKGPNDGADDIEVTTHNSLSWLQGCIVSVDENGEIFRRTYGKPLDESQPTVISVPVADYAGAEKIFLSWVAPTKDVTKVEGGYEYNLTDENGNAQGSVSFRAVEGEAGVIARMSVAEGTDLKHISEVNFIDHNLWPENDGYEKVEAGKIYEIEACKLTWKLGRFSNTFNDPVMEPLPFYCIQGNTDGKEGILVWLSPDSNTESVHPRAEYIYAENVRKYLSTHADAEKVRDFYNENPEFWKKMLKEMDAKGYEWSAQDWDDATGRSEFVLNYEFALGIGYLDLDGEKAKIKLTNYPFDYYWYRYIYIRTIPAYIE